MLIAVLAPAALTTDSQGQDWSIPCPTQSATYDQTAGNSVVRLTGLNDSRGIWETFDTYSFCSAVGYSK